MSFDKQKDLKMTQQTVSFLMLTFIFAFFSFSLPHFVSSAKLLYNGTADVELKTLVQTKSGPIVGLITTRNGVNVSCYLGIPYAEAPLGNLRFSEPIAVRSWKKTYPAVRQPPICYQREWSRFRPTDFEVVRELMKEDAAVHDFYLTHKDEDCLYLSVYTQTVPNRKRVAANKTTLVWIHGGAFISGAANLPFHTFAFMVASDPNLIVVSVNYRLNVFGFLTTGTKSMPGNLGLKDQILALRFVKANIGAFGGDPKKVVLWGQSAGAVSIGYHMMSRKSGDLLFKRAILESGNPLLPLTLASPSYRQNAFLDFIDKFNCSTESDHTGDSAKWIDQNWAKKLLPCLQSLSASQLFSEYQKFALHTPLAFLPNVQDRSLFSFSSFWKGVRSGSYTFSGDILSGTNEAEGAQYVKIGPLESFYSRNEISANFTRSNVLAKLTSFVPENLRSMVEPVVDVLADGVEDPNNSTQMWQRYVQLVGDMVFVCPDFYFLRGYLDRQASNRRKSHLASVYYYRFRPLVSHPVDCPRWSLGACHTDELQFFFGKPLLLPSLYPPEERQLSRSMLTTLLDFAHGSSLSSERSNVSFSHWRPFTKDNPEYLQIDLTEAKMVKGFPGQRCEELCEPLYELLESMDDSQMKLIKTKIV